MWNVSKYQISSRRHDNWHKTNETVREEGEIFLYEMEERQLLAAKICIFLLQNQTE